ncbi:MAG: hypothetical protein DRN24_01180 [Thermoplasmata archaeon]|nr:MAG: hypothetical protein DRN24_01180 [Thermoplasmata archaeon]
MKEIKKFERLKLGKHYKVENREDEKDRFICQVVKKNTTDSIKGFIVKILKGSNLEEGNNIKVSFIEFRKYKWFELTEDEAVIEML